MSRRVLPLIVLSAGLLLAPLRASARDVAMEFGTPLNTVPTLVEVKLKLLGLPPLTIPAWIPPGVPATVKAQIIGAALAAAGFDVDILPFGLPMIIIQNLKPGVNVRFVDHGTGERPDKFRLIMPPLPPPPELPEPGLGYGVMNYGIGHFEPFDAQGQPAIFTAGIVTDVGELTVQVSAQELNFQTDGPIICQALFQRLAPRAPQYGAQINYAGDRLEVYFDPAYTVTQGGIIFGTSSRQGESGASIDVPVPTSPPPVEFKFSLPIAPFPSQLMLNFTILGSGTVNVPVEILPGTSVLTKRDSAVEAMRSAGAPANPRTQDTCVVGNLAPGSQVRLTDMGTCEASDGIKSRGTTNATAGFPGFFQPMAPNNQPAVFTAGIVTDVGELTAQVSAQELNFQTDGPIICQALFQRLAPRAPQYGAQINYAGDRLEVYFDPAYTVTQGGIIFGTSSPTPGNFGQITLPPASPPTPVNPGDMNCDGEVNALDIQPFMTALISPEVFEEVYPGCNTLNGDMNGDGVLDHLDVDPFVQRVMHGG